MAYFEQEVKNLYLMDELIYSTTAVPKPKNVYIENNRLYAEISSKYTNVLLRFTNRETGVATEKLITNFVSGMDLPMDLPSGFYNVDVATAVDMSTHSAFVYAGYYEVIEITCLKFTAAQANSTVRLTVVGLSEIDMQYSYSGVTWYDALNMTVSLPEIGDHVFFKGNNLDKVFSSSKYMKFVMTGKIEASGNVTSLLDENMNVPALPDYAFYYLFHYCKSLLTPPELPSVELGEGCYYSMFYECSALTVAPELPALTMKNRCYCSMFDGCTSLTKAPDLPSTELADYCYASMFYGCTSLKEGYKDSDETIITPELPATVMKLGCYRAMFAACASLTKTPELPATELAEECYSYMFTECHGLTEIPDLPADTLAKECYQGMFNKCNGLVELSVLPAMNLAMSCYLQMFAECPNLVKAPELPATTLAEACYYMMFMGCTSLTDVPDLLAMNLADSCYYEMFMNCRSLVEAPSLPATTLAQACYEEMFCSCISLKKAPKLPALTVASGCYYQMFSYCTVLEIPPELPATTVQGTAYLEMFKSCTSLKRLPALPATDIPMWCYNAMFYGCTNIKVSASLTEDYARPYRIPSSGTGTAGYQALENMFRETGGPFTGTPSINTMYYLAGVIEELTFTAQQAGSTVLLRKNGSLNPNMEYSTDGLNWQTYTFDTQIQLANAGDKVYFRGDNTDLNFSITDYMKFYIGGKVAASGNCMSILDSTMQLDAVPDYGFYKLFSEIPLALTSAPDLPATAVGKYGYAHMFDGTDIASAPNLPATELDDYCYYSMFQGNMSLIETPDLPAEILAPHCYESMFNMCWSLTEIGEMSATTLAESCYLNMFANCRALTKLPELPVKELAPNCYYCMFNGCENIKLSQTQGGQYQNSFRIPSTGDGIDAANALYNMFGGTGGEFTGTPTINTGYFVAKQTELTLTALESGYIELNDMTSSSSAEMEYSVNGGIWQTYDWTQINLNINDRVSFRGNNSTLPFSTGSYLKFSSNIKFEASGNIMSILDKTMTLNSMPAYGFYFLFANCNIVKAPELPATTLGKNCYREMFSRCKYLITPPTELPAETLPENCYISMFSKCTSLLNTPKILAKTLADNCCLSMFSECSSLIEISDLPAKTLVSSCYEGMFILCTNLKLSKTKTGDYQIPYRIPSEGTGIMADPHATNHMFDGTGGTFTDDPEINTTYYLYKEGSGLPRPSNVTLNETTLSASLSLGISQAKIKVGTVEKIINWTGTYDFSQDLSSQAEGKIEVGIWSYKEGELSEYVKAGEYVYAKSLKLTALEANSWISLNITGSLSGANMEYSRDGLTWYNYTFGSSQTLANVGDFVYLRGANTSLTFSTSNHFQFAMGGKISASNEIISIIDKTFATTRIPDYGFYMLFYNCSSLIDPPEEIPDLSLGKSCCEQMFNLSGITSSPELKPLYLSERCYCNMFYGCQSLVTIRPIYAFSLGRQSCYQMFMSCFAIERIPHLSFQYVEYDSCYAMFSGCVNLITLPKLYPTTMAAYCYCLMFSTCAKIKLSSTKTGEYVNEYRIPFEGTGTSADHDTYNMFQRTGGTVTGSPPLNTTVYTSNEIV